MLKFCLLLAFSLFLFACSSVPYDTQGYIEGSDWGAVGNNDGSDGFPEKSQQQLQSLSDKYNGGVVNYKQYQEAYLAAVSVYCELSNARRLGALGKPYMNACDRFSYGGIFYHNWMTSTRSSASE